MEVEDLLEGGIEIPDDPEALAKLAEELGVDLEGVETTEQVDPKPQPDSTDDTQTLEEAAKAADDKAAEEAKSDKGKPEDKPAESLETKRDDGPPKAVLRVERENRHKAEREAEQEREARLKAEQRVAELESIVAKAGGKQDQLQDAANKITGDASIKLEKLDPAALDKLKLDLDDDSVAFLSKLVSQHNALTEQLDRVAKANETLVAERQQTQADSLQDDIDAVPLLAVIEAKGTKESEALMDRAIAYDNAIKSDPDWADRPRRERFEEVGRRLQGYIGSNVPDWLSEVLTKSDDSTASSTRDKKVEDKLAAARNKATPDSLSDLPAGVASAQSELDRLEAMSGFDVDDLIDKALAKGPDAMNELTARMMTAER